MNDAATLCRNRRSFIVSIISIACSVCIMLTTGCGLLLSPPQKDGISEDTIYYQAMRLGIQSWQDGQIDAANQMFIQALDRAHMMDAAKNISDAAYNLAACKMIFQQWDQAISLLDEALLTGYHVDDSLLLKARSLYMIGKIDMAQESAEQALKAAQGNNHQEVAIEAQLQLGLFACKAKNESIAYSWLSRAKRTSATPLKSALDKQLTGCLAELANHPGQAASLYDEETNILREQKMYSALPASLARAGSAYAAAGDHKNALDRYYRAAQTAASYRFNKETSHYAELGLHEAQQEHRTDYITVLQSLKDTTHTDFDDTTMKNSKQTTSTP